MARIVALLRGINVGGNHVIKMPALKATFERLGMKDVSTYIASGNVLFTAPKASASLATRIGAALEEEYGFAVPTTVREAGEFSALVKAAPKGFGVDAETYRYDVFFLFPELKAADAVKQLNPRAGVDTAHAGEGVVYFRRSVERSKESVLEKFSSSRIAPLVTVRNWNTTSKLHALLSASPLA